MAEDQSEPLIETLVYRILDHLYSRFRRSLRDVNRHIGKGVLEQHAVSDGLCFLGDSQQPFNLLIVISLLSKLDHSILVSIEINVWLVFVSDRENIGLILKLPNKVVLACSPVPEDQSA